MSHVSQTIDAILALTIAAGMYLETLGWFTFGIYMQEARWQRKSSDSADTPPTSRAVLTFNDVAPRYFAYLLSSPVTSRASVRWSLGIISQFGISRE